MPEQLLAQKPTVEKYLAASPMDLSSCSFVNIFAWQKFFTFSFKVIGGCLCVFAKNEIGTFLYLPPLGRNVTPKVIEDGFRTMEADNRSSGVTRIENVSERQLTWFPPKTFARYNKGYEYCYLRESIAGLRGNDYKSKRSSYNQFTSRCAHEYLPYEEAMFDECRALYGQWAKGRAAAHPDEVYCSMLEENQEVHALVIKHFRPLGLTGRVVTIDGKIAAYSFGFPVNARMFCVLFEVADLNVKGLAVYLFSQFCRDEVLREYKFINVMDDLGMEHMRETKMSFHPSVLLPSYIVTRAK